MHLSPSESWHATSFSFSSGSNSNTQSTQDYHERIFQLINNPNVVHLQPFTMAAENAATNVGFHQRDHDILSLLSIFTRSHRTLTVGLLLV